ncbi:MAG: glycosyltransferase [Hyphomicrobiales bacterium]
MKIVLAATTPMAVNAFLKGHLRALAASHDLVLVVNQTSFPLDQDVAQFARVVHIAFQRKISPLMDMKCLLQICLLLLREKPDAVHSILPKTGMLCMLAAFLTMRPRRFHTFTGQVWANKSGFKRHILKALDRLIASLATQVLADSRSQARFIEEQGVAKPNTVMVLGHGSVGGVDAVRFKPDADTRRAMRSRLNAQADTCVFLFLGRVTRDKGIFDLLAAFSRVAQSNPRCTLWIAGPDEEQIAEHWTGTQGIDAGHVQWLGLTRTPEQFMAAADVFVLPSYREGFGLVVIEAAACGLATIAYKVPGVVDAVADGLSGSLVPVGDTNALAHSMLSLSRDPLSRAKLGTLARERALTLYDSSSITRNWVEFYERAARATP